jgi:hypothetical protein
VSEQQKQAISSRSVVKWRLMRKDASPCCCVLCCEVCEAQTFEDVEEERFQGASEWHKRSAERLVVLAQRLGQAAAAEGGDAEARKHLQEEGRAEAAARLVAITNQEPSPFTARQAATALGRGGGQSIDGEGVAVVANS